MHGFIMDITMQPLGPGLLASVCSDCFVCLCAERMRHCCVSVASDAKPSASALARTLQRRLPAACMYGVFCISIHAYSIPSVARLVLLRTLRADFV